MAQGGGEKTFLPPNTLLLNILYTYPFSDVSSFLVSYTHLAGVTSLLSWHLVVSIANFVSASFRYESHLRSLCPRRSKCQQPHQCDSKPAGGDHVQHPANVLLLRYGIVVCAHHWYLVFAGPKVVHVDGSVSDPDRQEHCPDGLADGPSCLGEEDQVEGRKEGDECLFVFALAPSKRPISCQLSKMNRHKHPKRR